MGQSRPVQTAGAFAISGALAGAVGTGLSSGGWGQSLLYAIPVAAILFLTLWALLDYKQHK